MEVSCPICHKMIEWEGNRFRPFCSERCKLIDLGHWAAESYRVPSKSEEEEESPSANPAEEDEEASQGPSNGSQNGS
jgi:endogenous inhibitor of DNA gyrase (YacG/DUF329 family)